MWSKAIKYEAHEEMSKTMKGQRQGQLQKIRGDKFNNNDESQGW